MNFNLLKLASIIKESSKRIRDRGIRWQENYHTRSASLKKKMNKILGPGSYYRWEGHDYTTNSDYFVVVGPSITKTGQKAFFAGIKKLPPKERRKKVYAPYGKYFSSIMSALTYASTKWGIPFPQNQHPYSAGDLVNIKIPRHIKG